LQIGKAKSIFKVVQNIFWNIEFAFFQTKSESLDKLIYLIPTLRRILKSEMNIALTSTST